jgi:hypothetical protein
MSNVRLSFGEFTLNKLQMQIILIKVQGERVKINQHLIQR